MEEFVVDYMCKRKGVLRVKSTVWWDSYVKHTAVSNIKPLMTLVFFSFIDCSPVESLNDHLRIIFPKHHRSLQIEDKHCVLSTDCFVWWYYYYEHGHTFSSCKLDSLFIPCNNWKHEPQCRSSGPYRGEVISKSHTAHGDRLRTRKDRKQVDRLRLHWIELNHVF